MFFGIFPYLKFAYWHEKDFPKCFSETKFNLTMLSDFMLAAYTIFLVIRVIFLCRLRDRLYGMDSYFSYLLL